MMRYGSMIAIFVIALIQLTQQILMSTLTDSEFPITVTPFFNLVTVWNPGISFGMLQNIPNGQWILSGLAIVVIAWLLTWLRKTSDRFTAIALGLIIGGALGNVIDRLRFAAVFYI